MIYVDPPFELGSTLQGTKAHDSTKLVNEEVLGKLFYFPYQRLSGSQIRGNKERFTGKKIGAIACRNTSGGALLPKRLARLERTAGYDLMEEADGYSAVEFEKLLVIVDPWLPSAGVADDDIFWGIVSGPAIVQLSLAASADQVVVNVGDPVVAATAATTGATTAGRVRALSLPGTTGATDAFSAAKYTVGHALSAATTADTGADLLIDACLL